MESCSWRSSTCWSQEAAPALVRKLVTVVAGSRNETLGWFVFPLKRIQKPLKIKVVNGRNSVLI